MSAQFTTDLPEFVGRHIGPSADDVAAMLAAVGTSSLDALVDHALPGAIRTDGPLRIDPAASEARRRRGAARPGSSQPGDDVDDRARLLRHDHPGGHPAQRPGEPRLVHRLHALPARDLPGPARGAAQLPDRRQRPHRPDHVRGVAARRGDRRRRGDDPDASLQQDRRRCRPRRRPARLPADPRRDADPRQAARPRGRRRRPRRLSTPPTRCGPLRGTVASSASSCSTPEPTASCATGVRWPRPPTRPARSSPPPPTCSRSPWPRRRGSGAPTSPSAPASASACRWASAARTRAT